MTGAGRYTIAELVERTGIPATTIHHYRNAGLLPPPERVGANRFRYSERHVQALRLIRLLRDRRRLPLPTIREVLPELLASGDAEAFHADTWEAALTARSEVPDATRERIVAAAVDLFAARGYGDVAVSDVAAQAGTAKGSVYRHFESKEALFAAAVESVVAGVVGDVRAAANRATGSWRMRRSPASSTASARSSRDRARQASAPSRSSCSWRGRPCAPSSAPGDPEGVA